MDGHSAIRLNATSGRTLPRPGLIALAAIAACVCCGFVSWSLVSGRSEPVAPESFGVLLEAAGEAEPAPIPMPVPVPGERTPRAVLMLDGATTNADELGVVNAHLESTVDPDSATVLPAAFSPDPASMRAAWLSGAIEPLGDGPVATVR